MKRSIAPRHKRKSGTAGRIVLIGSFKLGYENVQVYVTLGKGGGSSGNLCPKDTRQTGVITVAVDSRHWGFVIGDLLHEAGEYQMVRQGFCKVPSLKTSEDSGDCMFVYSHAQFSEICARTGAFLAAVVPKLATVYNQLHAQSGEDHAP